MNTPDQTNPIEQRNHPETSPTLQFSEAEPAFVFRTCLELDQALHQAETHSTSRRPIVAHLHIHGHRLGIGLGYPVSFVSIQRCEPTPGPGFISLGDARAKLNAVFFLLGWRRMEIPQRNLVPAAKAREILREFFETGIRSTSIDWETLHTET